jgi:hypothetical protein
VRAAGGVEVEVDRERDRCVGVVAGDHRDVLDLAVEVVGRARPVGCAELGSDALRAAVGGVDDGGVVEPGRDRALPR